MELLRARTQGNNLLRGKEEGKALDLLPALGFESRGLRQEIAYQRFIWKCFSRLRYGRCLDRLEVASEGARGKSLHENKNGKIQEGRGDLWGQIAPALGVQSR